MSESKAGQRRLDPWSWSDGFSTPLWQFDFDGGLFSTQTGYRSVRGSDLYDFSGLTGYGWSTAVTSFDRGAGRISDANAQLLRDGHYGYDATFLVDLPAAGDYLVNVLIGDASPFYHDQIEVTAEGASTPQLTVNTQAGQWSSPASSSGQRWQLSLRLRDAGGADPNFVINALRVRPKPASPIDPSNADPPRAAAPLDADGTTVDAFSGSGAPANSLVTVATTLGTVPTSPGREQHVPGRAGAGGRSRARSHSRSSGRRAPAAAAMRRRRSRRRRCWDGTWARRRRSTSRRRAGDGAAV